MTSDSQSEDEGFDPPTEYQVQTDEGTLGRSGIHSYIHGDELAIDYAIAICYPAESVDVDTVNDVTK